MKYIGIKLVSLDYFVWFKLENVKEDSISFTGTLGWGKGKELTSIEVKDLNLIQARIWSDTL